MSTSKLISIIIPTCNRRDDVLLCVESILSSSYKNIEVIVVDNASNDNTDIAIEKKYAGNRKVKLVKSKTNLGAGGGRNLGVKKASGDYLLFVDSDNIVDRKMVEVLSRFFNEKPDCGMVGPLMLYKADPKKIWMYSADINMFTSQAIYKGAGEKNAKQYDRAIEVGHLPNCFMTNTKVFKKTGGFEEKYQVVYEEADLAEKIKKTGKKIYVYTEAVTQHNVPLPGVGKDRDLGFRTKERAFLLARNRIYFMKRNAKPLQLIVFFLLFNPLFLIYYESQLILKRDYVKAWFYLKGVVAGLVM